MGASTIEAMEEGCIDDDDGSGSGRGRKAETAPNRRTGASPGSVNPDSGAWPPSFAQLSASQG
ncbi:hypothetical protein GCM10009825_28260 [Arthrobacter humicola]|uniref:Uncharacterized protein n=1 Tax=Arthrobacter humicola TaxID=409291 RepID=A0ABN2ZDA9_9MICC